MIERKPSVVRQTILSMQVCCPKEWTDEQVKEFAEKENPCGTTGGWGIRREGDELLQGAPERAKCEVLADYVHIMLDA